MGVANLSLKLLVGSSNIDHTRAGKAAAPYGMKKGARLRRRVKMGRPPKFTDHLTRASRSGDAMMATRRLPKLVTLIM